MSIYDQIIAEYPELVGSSNFRDGTIILQDDSDGLGAYVAAWNYSKPLPDGMKVGKE